MIDKKTFYAVKCNRCGDYNKGGDYTFHSDEDDAIDAAYESNWLLHSNYRHYCPNCWIEKDGAKHPLPDYPDVVKRAIKFIRSLEAGVKVVSDTAGCFALSVEFYDNRILEEYEKIYLENLIGDDLISIKKERFRSLIKIKNNQHEGND